MTDLSKAWKRGNEHAIEADSRFLTWKQAQTLFGEGEMYRLREKRETLTDGEFTAFYSDPWVFVKQVQQ